jgi:hypothetical protein
MPPRHAGFRVRLTAVRQGRTMLWFASGAGPGALARCYPAYPGNTASILAFSVAALNGLTM